MKQLACAIVLLCSCARIWANTHTQALTQPGLNIQPTSLQKVSFAGRPAFSRSVSKNILLTTGIVSSIITILSIRGHLKMAGTDLFPRYYGYGGDAFALLFSAAVIRIAIK
jgi:hypothetical protein